MRDNIINISISLISSFLFFLLTFTAHHPHLRARCWYHHFILTLLYIFRTELFYCGTFHPVKQYYKIYYCYCLKILEFDIIYRLSRAAIAKFKDITKKSASGLKHAIEKHKYTDIRVDIRPSYLIIPHGGRYQE